ncbi:AraC family transcriptional regulator [Salmonella enterica subsp. enterica serovar Poona]|nr:AraC family transcriptional regulator [Salmonella enterica]ECH6755887.1 AraC family transcriptional regulator [Salmonella enterica subsp. enterica serovar Newport]ECO1514157.1 AraC family transcriptional regulator [Salmonella enterica subsp. arizonae]EDJ2557717.1 AraC family transcriptional regulator [Salmonella enterica subsp. enterica serovar Poona]EFT4510261.1 AraC family transcriptional regulator [Salmonella enterica subsp. enterica serovar Stanley]
MSLLNSLKNFDIDLNPNPVVVLRVQSRERDEELPFHVHRKGQLILTLHGGVTCLAPDAYWMVPAKCAAWIPPGQLHSNRVTHNAEVLFLYLEPDVPGMPEKCCTLHISTMLCEMMQHFETFPQNYTSSSYPARFAQIILYELSRMPVERLSLPVSDNVKIRALADRLMNNPGDRSSPEVWAGKQAMSRRTFERFILKETGMTFGRWRQQLQLLVAIRLLVTGTSVQNTAHELGYSSVTAFITMFKKMLGTTPGRYLGSNSK